MFLRRMWGENMGPIKIVSALAETETISIQYGEAPAEETTDTPTTDTPGEASDGDMETTETTKTTTGGDKTTTETTDSGSVDSTKGGD